MHIKIAELASMDGGGCAFLLDLGAPGVSGIVSCNEPRRPGSDYCPEHHARCHLPAGSAAEDRRLRAIEALAQEVGGRLGREAAAPPEPILRRLQRVERAFSRRDCSRYVRKECR